MNLPQIITKKRDGGSLTSQEIDFAISGYTSGAVPDYQMSALLMAIYFNGMIPEETASLTYAMLHSGDVIDLHKVGVPSLHGPFVDKHSTGGVGDKVSLVLAPIVAACGVQIPMMCGRGLGHTGGTIDKLESIDGYRMDFSPNEMADVIAKTGYVIMGQTKNIAPADKLLYALRDVTGTVESIPLITASILSKKIAEGSDCLVFDVKCGSGAFMKDIDGARKLAHSLIDTVSALSKMEKACHPKKAVALITNMTSPLGLAVGNFLETQEAVDCLCGNGPDDVMSITLALAAKMLILGHVAKNQDVALEMCQKVIADGSALKKFYENVDMQGGDVAKFKKDLHTWRSSFEKVFCAQKTGYLAIDAHRIGLCAVALGAGRAKKDDDVSPTAGILFQKTHGCLVQKGEAIATLYGKDADSLQEGITQIEDAISYLDNPPPKIPLIMETIE